jgi:hypothetical protein
MQMETFPLWGGFHLEEMRNGSLLPIVLVETLCELTNVYGRETR